jgi:hypothetical protein
MADNEVIVGLAELWFWQEGSCAGHMVFEEVEEGSSLRLHPREDLVEG